MPTKPKAQSKASAAVEIHGVRLTHPDRVLYEEQGITKRGLAEYYVAVADWILPHLIDRPLSLVRCPAGLSGPCFFQKQPPQGLPASVKRKRIRLKEGTTEGLYVEDLAGAVALVQFGVLELHTWQSHVDDIERPDQLVFDFDPGPEVGWPSVISAAVLLRDFLKELGLTSFVKTTGGKGLHVVAPIERRHEWPKIKQFCKSIAEAIARADPTHYTTTLSKAARRGKIFVDYLRNERGATAVVAYSTRAKPGAPVSMPVTWNDLRKTKGANTFTLQDVQARANRGVRDPWRDLPHLEQAISDAAFKAVTQWRPEHLG